MKKKDNSILSVKDFVVKNTGMDVKTLLHDTNEYQFSALEKAAELIRKWKEEEKKFFVFADYDVDGITSGESMRMLLRAIGVPKNNIIVRYPKRFSEGYGMSVKAVNQFDSNGVIITVDNGVAAFEAIKAAKAKGMAVLVTDHHLASIDENGKKVYPEADYIIDPNAIDEQAEFTAYCGCGIVFKLATRMLKAGNEKTLARIRTNAAIATVADCVPLIGENRRIVKEGLMLATHKDIQTTGLSALLAECNLQGHVSETDVAFKIAPCLNAVGRLNDDGAAVSARLISFDGDELSASKLAKAQVEKNEERKVLQKTWDMKADSMIEDDDNAIILQPEGCPEGLAGIIAGRIADRRNKPTIIFTDNGNGILKGSGRSVEGVNLKALLDQCQDTLVSYGGHAMAAGLKVKDLFAFKNAFNDALRKCGWTATTETEQTYDLEINGSDVLAVVEEIEKFAPYGEGNPAPTFYIQNVELTPKGSSYYSELKNEGVKLFADGYSATTFKATKKFMDEKPRRVNLFGTIARNYFCGNSYVDVHFDDMEAVAEKNVKRTSLQKMLDEAAMRLGSI